MLNEPLSVIVDESTDVSCDKHMYFVVRYFSKRHNTIVSRFIGLVKVDRTDAQTLYNVVLKFFSDISINIKLCSAIGTYGTNNLCGTHNSLYSKLKTLIPNIILVKCISHSLHLACSYAFHILLDSIDILIRDTYSFLSKSPLRLEEYRNLYKIINNERSPPKFIPISATRWLEVGPCL
ncbi:hypothetical protein A3Q56_00859 [Intoshia linei]|uniref:Uncharacterized protein n=1 Tax=Intoshia linei TaxID=1819745 RepID=A0A177BAM5_9BILA|nr:hypothetical protein A3Q56_00859 [Intoshia linei]